MKAVETAWAEGAAKTVVELGPGSTLLTLAKRIVGEEGPQWIASSHALRWGRGPGLFRHVPLGWDKPVSKLGSVKAKSAAEQATPATCVYETTWMPLPPATESTRHEGAHLLLSREAVAGVLPKGWRLSVAKEEAQLLAEASSQRWTTVVLWGSNTCLLYTSRCV